MEESYRSLRAIGRLETNSWNKPYLPLLIGIPFEAKFTGRQQPRQHNIHLLLSSDTCVYREREDANVYVGHYSEWRYLENVGRGRSVEIDVQKDQGLRRESRGRERREKENRAAEGGGREEGIQKGGKERRTTSRVTSCRLPRVFSSSTSTPPSLFVSSSSIISTSVPSQASTYLLSPKSFCFLRRRGMRGIVQLDSTRRWSFLATLPILVHANVSSNSNEDFFVRFIEYTILIRVRFRIWRKVQFIIRNFWTNALLSVKIRKSKKKNNYSTTITKYSF